MTRFPRQLPLDLPTRQAYGREDFLASRSNAAALAMIERWPDWPERRALLIGPPGSGKSHLAAIWAAKAGAGIVPAADLVQDDVPGLLASGALVVEDGDRLGDREAALFHLLNLARERGAALLLTAGSPPGAWALTTPDLLSRLRALPTVTIEAPDEALLRALLVKLFADRQLLVEPDVIDYLMLRMERSFDVARLTVSAIDRESLSRSRRITRAIAADVLALDKSEEA